MKIIEMKTNLTEIKIEESIPLPPSKWSQIGGIAGVMRKMKIGDSFVFKTCSPYNFYAYAKLAGIKVTARSMKDGTFRCWRVA